MSTQKTIREMKDMIVDAGLKLLSVEHGKHIKFFVQAPDGRTKQVVIGISSSDHRAIMMRKKDLKLFREGVR